MDRREFIETVGVLGLAGGGIVGAGNAHAEGKRAAAADTRPNAKLAVVQLDTIACEVNLNVHKMMLWTRRAFENKARYVFLHEGATADYSPDPLKFGRPLESAEVHGFVMLCKRYNGFVAIGLNEVFENKPDLIFWQNNRGDVSDGQPNRHAKELRVPIVASNRCGFSYGHFQAGGSCMVADDGATVRQANKNGDEEIIYSDFRALIRT